MSNEKDDKRLIPSYAGISQAKDALDIFQRINAKHIDRDFIVGNGLTTAPNAHRLINLYRWLGIIDEDGNVPESVSAKLRLLGEERNEFIKELVMKSYSDLFESINVERAKFQEIVNFFITKYDFSASMALLAAGLFLGLCKEYNIPIADELKGKQKAPAGVVASSASRPRRTAPKEKNAEVKSHMVEHNEMSSLAALGDGSKPRAVMILKSNVGLNQTLEIEDDTDIEDAKDLLGFLKKRLEKGVKA